MVYSTRLWAQVNVSGKPGLIYIPSADVTQDGTLSMGYIYNPSNYAFRYNKRTSENIYFINLTLLPRLDVNLNLLIPTTNPGSRPGYTEEGIGDRQIDLKYVLMTEKKKRPSMAVILSQPFGVSVGSLVTYALAATKHVDLSKSVSAAVTVGMGSPYSIYRDENDGTNVDIFTKFRLLDNRTLAYQYLSGPFGGVNLSFARKGGLMVEWDSHHLNVGAYTTLFKHWTVQAGLLNGDQLTMGTSYTFNALRPSKRLANQEYRPTAEPVEMTEPVVQKKPRNVLPDYENLSVDSVQHEVSYEQRLYRNPFVGMLKLAKPLAPKGIQEFVPLFQGVPIARYQLATTASARTLSRQERTEWAKEHPFNSRAYKLDFRLQPAFTAQFGYRQQTVEAKTSLMLQSQLYLSRGLVLNWGVLFPIANHLDNQGLNVRPAPTFLNQFLALDGTNFMSLSAGLFYNDQYGVNVQYRHADLTKNWSYGLETGYTGFYFFPENGLYYESLQHFMLLGDIAYRIPKRDVTLRVSGGQYMFQDRGVRLDFIRQMGNLEVGFYATRTTNGATGGFSFAIPIPPGRIVQTGRFRVRTSEEFRWEYIYSRGFNMAKRYQVGYQLDALLRQYHQSYLQNQYR